MYIKSPFHIHQPNIEYLGGPRPMRHIAFDDHTKAYPLSGRPVALENCTMNAFIISLWKDEFLKLLLRFKFSFNPFCEQWMLSERFSRAYRNCRRPEIGWLKTDCRLAEKYDESIKRTVSFTKRGIIRVLELHLQEVICELFFCPIGYTSGEIFTYWLFKDTKRIFSSTFFRDL